MYSVYAIRCKETGKIYIGCTKYPEDRIKQHFRELSRKQKTVKDGKFRVPSAWQLDYDKYGESAFEFYLLESNISEEARFSREIFWIEEYKAFDSRYGYNTARYKSASISFTFINGKPPKPVQ